MSSEREEWKGVWRGGVNMVLYTVMFDPELDDTVVASVAKMIREGKLVDGGPQRFAGAIEAGLAQDGPLNDVIEAPHSEDEIRGFLRKLLQALDGEPS